MNPSFLSLCPDDNIKKKAVIPTAEYNRPVICQYTYRVSSVSTLLSELLDLKYPFYAFYPVHLLVLFAIAAVLGMAGVAVV